MTKTRVQAIILDLDGPLLEGRVRHHTVYRDILVRHGFTPLDEETYWQMKRERIDRRRQLAASGAESIYEEFLVSWMEMIEQAEYLSLDRVHAGVQETLDRWASRGIVLILATLRRDRDELHRQLEALGLRDYFRHVVVCDHGNGGIGKSNRVLGVEPGLDPARCLWIGDTEVDIEAARSLGCRVGVVTSGLRTEQYLRSLSPDFVGASLSELNFGEDGP